MFKKWFAKVLARAEAKRKEDAEMARVNREVATCTVLVYYDNNSCATVEFEKSGKAAYLSGLQMWTCYTADEKIRSAIANFKESVSQIGFTHNAVHYMPHRISHLQIGEIKITEKETA